MSQNIQSKQHTGLAPAEALSAMPLTDRESAQRAVKQAAGELEVVSLRGRDSISVAEAARLKPSVLMSQLAETAWNRAGSHTSHYCLRSVTNAMLANDVIDSRIAPRAIDGVSVLRNNPNMIEVENVKMRDLADLPEGTVVIYEKPGCGTSAAGHAQVLCGNGRAASDFRHDLNVYRGTPGRVYAFIPVAAGSHTFSRRPESSEFAAQPGLVAKVASAVGKLPFFRGRRSPATGQSPLPLMSESPKTDYTQNSTAAAPKDGKDDAQVQKQAAEIYKDLEETFGWKELRKINKQRADEQQWSESYGKEIKAREARRQAELATERSAADLLKTSKS